MNKAKILAFILLPILTWLLVLIYQYWRQHKILEVQREEFITALNQLEELGRKMKGVKVNHLFPLPLPFRYTYLSSPPPIGQGKTVLIWVTYHNEFNFRNEVVERWKRLLNEYPNLVLTVAIIGIGPEEIKTFGVPPISVKEIKLRMNHPRITILYSDDSLYTSLGGPGTIILVNGKGITCYVGKLKSCAPSKDDVEKLVEIIRKYGR